jgi:hypothetical protein
MHLLIATIHEPIRDIFVQIRQLLLIVLTVALLGAISACGSDDSAAAPDDSANQANVAATDTSDVSGNEENNSMIVDNGGNYSVDDFVAAGYKNVTQFELDTLPEAVDAWYGFHSQKDVELRFYESHGAAIEHGLESAKVAIGKGAVGYSKRPPLRWDAFAIVGNVVMLCELEIETCEALIADLN